MAIIDKRHLPETKTAIVRNLVANGMYADALSIVKSFRIGFTRDEKRTIQIAHECLGGFSRFYMDLGIDVNTEIKNAIGILLKHFTTNL